jgi:hypothetical protein
VAVWYDKGHNRSEVTMAKLGVTVFTALVIVSLGAVADITGTWEVEATFDDSSISGGGFDCSFKQDGERLTGTCAGGTAPLTGEVSGQNVTWRIGAGNPSATTTFTGVVDEGGISMMGRFTTDGKGGRFAGVKQ